MSTHTPARAAGTRDATERLQALVDRTVAKRGLAHAVIGAAQGDQGAQWVVVAGDARPGEPMRPETPFFIASVTKRFIATLALQADEQAELSLDDPITALLPDDLTDGLHTHKGVDHTPAITVHHLLTHTSGLPDYWDKTRRSPGLFKQMAQGEDRSWVMDDVIRWTREEHRPHFPPQDLSAHRQKARYTDAGFQLLIAALEEVTSLSFADLLHERILEPTGMVHTWLPGRSKPTVDTPEPAGIHAGTRPLELTQLVESCNDLISTADDLLRFQRALLRGELFDQPGTVARLTERNNLLRNMPPNRYGVGTWLFPINRLVAPGHQPLTLIGHAGATGSWLFTCPELDMHLVGTVNQSAGQRMPFRIMVQMLRAVTDT